MSSPAPYKIPIVDLRAQYDQIRSEIRQAINDVLETQQFILGPAVAGFEAQMASYLQCGYAVGVASGSDALLLALMALEIGAGDAVLVPPFTFFSTVSAITRLGARPLFVDIDPDTYLLGPLAAANFIDERCHLDGDRLLEAKSGLWVKALLPVHLFGRCCAMVELAALAMEYRLQIIEDVAQACGARTVTSGRVRFAGTIGRVGCLSFFPSKTLGGYGDGGLVTTDSSEVAGKVRMLRVHGENAKYHHQATGINSRLDSIQAAVLSVKQRYLDRWCGQRIQRAQTYHRLLTDSGLLGGEVLSIPTTTTDTSHVFNNYVIRARRRDDLKRFLAEQGIQTEVYYPAPLHLQPCFAELGHKQGDFPNAERSAAEVLALPMYPELTLDQQEVVVGKIREFFRQ